MNSKLFELRDRATFIPVMATKVEGRNDAERYLLRRSGFGLPSDMVIMTGLAGGLDKATCDPYDWGGSRTRMIAHDYIAKNFDKLDSGSVIDVEYILGETDQPKASEAVFVL